MPHSCIGVWNTAFLGDAILTLPLLQNLRAAYPQTPIHFWVRKGYGSLFTAHPAITQVFEYDKRGTEKSYRSAMRLGKQLAHERYSVWISAHSSLRSGALARWSSAKIRIGYKHPWYNSWLYTRTVDRRFTELEEIERLLQLLHPLNIPVTETWPHIVLPQDSLAKSAEIFAGFAASRNGAPLLGMHPGSVWGTKRWAPSSYAAVALRAMERGAGIVLFAGPGEEPMAAEVRRILWDAVPPVQRELLLDLSGALSLPELAACIGRLACYITNDSGPMHLAWPQHVPVTAIFGPTVRQLGFYPRGEGASVIEVPLPCRPCGLHGPQQCPQGHHRCMVDITPDMVWADVSRKLFPL